MYDRICCSCSDNFCCFALSFLFTGAIVVFLFFFFFKQKTAYEIGTGDWSSDVCSSDLAPTEVLGKSLQSRVKFYSGESLMSRRPPLRLV